MYSSGGLLRWRQTEDMNDWASAIIRTALRSNIPNREIPSSNKRHFCNLTNTFSETFFLYLLRAAAVVGAAAPP